MTETELHKCIRLGVQQEALCALDSAGPSALLNPSRIFRNFINIGLRPSFWDTHDFATFTNVSII